MTKSLVLTHDRCVDGTCAAAVAYQVFGPKAEYRGVSYGQSEPDDTENRDVFILDFCYPAEVLRSIADKANRLVVLDHHKTAEGWIDEAKHLFEGDPHVEITFDMQHSGAGLANQYFGLPQHWFVDYVEDRDLWRFKLPHSKTINAYIQSVPRSIFDYARVMDTISVEHARTMGEGAERYLEMYVSEVKRQARKTFVAGYDDIPIVNAPYVGISELVGALAEEAPFAIGWSVNAEGDYVFSLRSRGEVDVAELAARWGGGGHKGAAGFRTKTLPDWVRDAEARESGDHKG